MKIMSPFFSGSGDKTIIQWNLFFKDSGFVLEKNNSKKEKIAGKPEKVIKEHTNSITSLSLSENQLFSSSLDKKIIIWDIPGLIKNTVIEESESEILALDKQFDDKWIIVGKKNNKINYFNLKGEKKYYDDLDGYPTCFLNIKIERNKYLAVGLSNGNIIIYNKNFKKVKIITLRDKIMENSNNSEIKDKEEQYSISSMSVDELGEFLFIGYKNGTIFIYRLVLDDSDEVEEIKQTDKNDKEINCLLFESKYITVYFVADKEGLKMYHTGSYFKKKMFSR